MFGVEILTGPVLLGLQGEGWAGASPAGCFRWSRLPIIRFIHVLIMWLTWDS